MFFIKPQSKYVDFNSTENECKPENSAVYVPMSCTYELPAIGERE